MGWVLTCEGQTLCEGAGDGHEFRGGFTESFPLAGGSPGQYGAAQLPPTQRRDRRRSVRSRMFPVDRAAYDAGEVIVIAVRRRLVYNRLSNPSVTARRR